MKNTQKRTLILASIIGTLFGNYDEDEKTKLHKELHARIGKGIRKTASKYTRKIVEEVAHNDGNMIWKKAVDHFKKDKITIEASSCILAIWNLDEKALTKYYGLGAGKLGKWAKPSTRHDAVELEQNGNKVARFIFNEVNTLYSIEVEKKLSFMERLELSRKVA